MALAASSGSGRELNVSHGQFHIRRLVAIGTSDCAMRTLKWKLRARVIKLRKFFPFFGRVADFAPQWFSFCVKARHPFGKLTFVNILMSTGAAELLKVIESHAGAG